VRPQDLGATIYHALGVRSTFDWKGRLHPSHHHGEPILDLFG